MLSTYIYRFVHFASKFFLTLFTRQHVVIADEKDTSPLTESNSDQTATQTIFVVQANTFANKAMLRLICDKKGFVQVDDRITLPSGETLPRYIFLNDTRILFKQKQPHSGSQMLARMIHTAREAQLNLRFLPVSIFFGRYPGHENSVIRTIFLDDEGISPLRRILAILFNGRQTFVKFSQVLNPETLMQSGQTDLKVGQKIFRVLNIHLRRQRAISMGPAFFSKRTLHNAVIGSDLVRQAIELESQKGKHGKQEAKALAKKYLDEMASTPSYPVLKLFDRLLTWLWNKLYDGVEAQNLQLIHELPANTEIVYVSSHRSHMDYLLLSYVLYYHGLMPPHIAAGINLNFFLIGSMLRKAGGVFMRRTFHSNRLYSAVFTEYLHYLFSKGISVEYFPEGGRTRTGRLLDPKMGMINITVQGALRISKRPITIVPVYFGYERIMEVSTYVREMRGHSKQNESFMQLFNTRKQLKQPFGKVYVNFGQPIQVNDFVAQRTTEAQLNNDANTYLRPVVRELALEVCQRINSAAALNSVALVSGILLTQHQNAMVHDNLASTLEQLYRMFNKVPYHRLTVLPEMTAEEIIAQAVKVGGIEVSQSEFGPLYHVTPEKAGILVFYRNNITHCFALAGLIATHLNTSETVNVSDIKQNLNVLYNFVRSEFYLHWDKDEINRLVDDYLDFFMTEKVIESVADNCVYLCNSTEINDFIEMLSSWIQPTIERYGAVLALIHDRRADGELPSRGQLASKGSKLAKAYHQLEGDDFPEFYDKGVISAFVNQLFDDHWLASTEDDESKNINTLSELIWTLAPKRTRSRMEDLLAHRH